MDLNWNWQIIWFRYRRLNPWIADQKLPLNKVSYLSVLSYSYLFSPHIPFSLFSPPTYLGCDVFMTYRGHSYFKTQTDVCSFAKSIFKLYINHQLDAQIIIYSYNITFLYMFRAINAHLQEVTLYTCSIWYCTVNLYERSWWPVGTHWVSQFSLNQCTDGPPRPLVESYGIICCMYTMWPPEDEHLWLETCTGM